MSTKEKNKRQFCILIPDTSEATEKWGPDD